MSTAKIKHCNSDQFLVDIKSASCCMVETLTGFYKIRKKEVLEVAENRQIEYYMTDRIFKVKRKVMVLV